MWVGQNNTIKSTSTRSHIGLFSNSRRKHVSMLYDSMSEPDDQTDHAGQSSEHLSQILTELRSLTSSVKEVSDRVDRLAETVYGPPKKRSPAESGSSHWADRDNEMLDDLPPPRWDSEDGDVDRFATLSERNESLLLSAFSSTQSDGGLGAPSPHQGSKRLIALAWILYSDPRPKRTSSGELARLQAFVLDVVGPLVDLWNGLENPEYSSEHANLAINEAGEETNRTGGGNLGFRRATSLLPSRSPQSGPMLFPRV